MLVEGREAWLAWLFCLELLRFLMNFSFLLELEQTTFFLTVEVMLRVVLRLQVEYSLFCNSVANLLVELFMEYWSDLWE